MASINFLMAAVTKDIGKMVVDMVKEYIFTQMVKKKNAITGMERLKNKVVKIYERLFMDFEYGMKERIGPRN